ncbi:MAG TPA: M23 family metallopeptidase, partial [Caulobacteraceae bacterium]
MACPRSRLAISSASLTHEFEPGRPGRPWLHRAAVGLAVCACLGVGWRLAADGAKAAADDPAARSLAGPGAVPDGYRAPRDIAIELKPGESLELGLERAGAIHAEATEAALALLQDRDLTSLATDEIEASIAKPKFFFGAPRLLGVAAHTNTGETLIVARGFDGVLRLRPSSAPARSVTTVATGVMQGSLYESAEKVGADLTLIAKLVKLFSHRLDLARDVRPGDRFTLVFDRKVASSGATVETGGLRYAEMAAPGRAKGRTLRFYAFDHDGQTDFFDQYGVAIKGLLLRTPVDGAHITSTFGMREHPLLGYTRMHKGIDFGAETGTPVLAAGDGVVVERRVWGGYGNWLKIRHAGGWETGYGHLSAYAQGLRPGMHVTQGQIVAYVGATGLATGPHLHYEIWRGGARVNPTGAAARQGAALHGAQLIAFRQQRARIDGMRKAAGPAGTTVAV